MNLKQLEAFVHVADGRSFSKAARELFLTQPTVSAHISSLEKELDARLFVRNTKEVDLSSDGELLYKYAKQMVELERKIEQTFLERPEDKQSCITIAASTVPAQYLLPAVLAKFMEKYPKEQFRVLETDSAQVVELIVEEKADVGFTGTMLEKKHCKYIPFYQDELVVIAPNTEYYQQFLKQPEEVSWIKGEPLILREEGSGTRKEAEKQLKKRGIAMGHLNLVASIENQETIKKSIRKGMGISIMSKLAVEEEVKAGSILCFPLAEDDCRAINVVYNKNKQLSLASERFVKTVKEVYKK